MSSCEWFPLSREEIDAWVSAHRHELPRDLAGLARFPMAFRKAILVALPGDVQISLWREHLLSSAASTELTPEQQTLLRDAIAALPVIFGESADEARGELEALNEVVKRLMTPQQMQSIFATLGPPEPPGGLPLPPGAAPVPPS